MCSLCDTLCVCQQHRPIREDKSPTLQTVLSFFKVTTYLHILTCSCEEYTRCIFMSFEFQFRPYKKYTTSGHTFVSWYYLSLCKLMNNIYLLILLMSLVLAFTRLDGQWWSSTHFYLAPVLCTVEICSTSSIYFSSMFNSVCLAVDDLEPWPTEPFPGHPAQCSSLLSTCPNHPNLPIKRASPQHPHSTPPCHLLTVPHSTPDLVSWPQPYTWASYGHTQPTLLSLRQGPCLSPIQDHRSNQASNTRPLRASVYYLYYHRTFIQ